MAEQIEFERKNLERIFARAFTVLGGVFWVLTAFFGGSNLLGAFTTAAYPLAFTIVVLAVGWFQERIAAIILALGAVGTVVWGAIMGWPLFVWGIMFTFFIAPTLIAAVLFYLAGDVTQVQSSPKNRAGIAT
jgi:hypothetical protein